MKIISAHAFCVYQLCNLRKLWCLNRSYTNPSFSLEIPYTHSQTTGHVISQWHNNGFLMVKQEEMRLLISITAMLILLTVHKIKTLKLEAGKLDQWLRRLIILIGILTLISNAYIRQIKSTYNGSSSGPATFLWPPQPLHSYVFTHT